MCKGIVREVFVEGMESPLCVETYTVPETARALGRSELGFKRWIKDGLIPEPILKDTSRGYKHYSLGEVRVLANLLLRHEQDFRYFSVKHTSAIHDIWQRMQAYRAHSV